MSQALRIRKNVTDLDQEEIDLLTKAFKGIMARDESKTKSQLEQSYFFLASYHGYPRHVCRHNDPLFLNWHRKYVRLFEDALRSVPGCENVTLPYWKAEDGLPPRWLN